MGEILCVILIALVIRFACGRQKRDITCRPQSDAERLDQYRLRMDAEVGLHTEAFERKLAKGLSTKLSDSGPRFIFGTRTGICNVRFPVNGKLPPSPEQLIPHPKVRAIGSKKR